MITSSTKKFQSTHPRGVRLSNSKSLFYYKRFNPRTREGCDVIIIYAKLILRQFQSTHPRGVRLLNILLNVLQICFNPRTREGCDVKGMDKIGLAESFNPRTREGCDLLGIANKGR